MDGQKITYVFSETSRGSLMPKTLMIFDDYNKLFDFVYDFAYNDKMRYNFWLYNFQVYMFDKFGEACKKNIKSKIVKEIEYKYKNKGSVSIP